MAIDSLFKIKWAIERSEKDGDLLTSDQIAQALNTFENLIFRSWSIEDIKKIDPDLSDQDCKEILLKFEHKIYHDPKFKNLFDDLLIDLIADQRISILALSNDKTI